VKTYTGGVRHDYNEIVLSAPPARWHHLSLFALGLTLPLVAVSVLLIGENSRSNVPSAAPPAARTALPVSLPTVLPAPRGIDSATPSETLTSHPVENLETSVVVEPAAELAAEAVDKVLEITVARGDTLEQLFRRNGLRLGDLAAMVSLPEAGRHLRLLRPGDALEITHRDGTVVSLQREIDEIDLLAITRNESGFESSVLKRPVERRVVGAQGRIKTSLFEAGTAAGVSNAIIMEMAGIFQWDIDFLQDVRIDDQFTVLYDELWRDDEKLRNGAIVAAEFINRGRTYRAARFTDSSGRTDYYTPDGRSVRKAFLRAPVDFTRISGNFDPSRKHPILNTIRAHRGVDYAAPRGTPVRAAGDGKISYRGPNGGFGNAVVIQHGGNITTLYAHLSRFAAPKLGSRVKQGDTIGYVGQSGLATGPHLHYEYRLNGIHRNPRTVTLPPADPVAAEDSEKFERFSSALWNQLDHYQRAWLVSNSQ
jgi:murein DD-endopeptidase MepM/ murein hydrolase activator NlpD